MEHRGVSCVVIAAVNGTGANHANRSVRLLAFQSTRLHAGGLGAQQIIFGNIEGILHIQCRMIRRQIQCGEVVVYILNFRTVTNIKAHTHEDFLNLTHGQCYGMQMTGFRLAARQSNINLLVSELVSQRLFLQHGSCFVDFAFQLSLDFVNNLADFRTLFGRQLAHAAQDFGHRAFFAQIFDAQVLKRIKRSYGSKLF